MGFERRATLAVEVTPENVRMIRVFKRGQDVEAHLSGDGS
jgi:hypothetical protein